MRLDYGAVKAFKHGFAQALAMLSFLIDYSSLGV
jgi:hypothetical protein